MKNIPLQVGQVWLDLDKRYPKAPNRFIVITALDKELASVQNPKTGTVTKIARDRMIPGSTGYQLMHDPALVADYTTQVRKFLGNKAEEVQLGDKKQRVKAKKKVGKLPATNQRRGLFLFPRS